MRHGKKRTGTSSGGLQPPKNLPAPNSSGGHHDGTGRVRCAESGRIIGNGVGPPLDDLTGGGDYYELRYLYLHGLFQAGRRKRWRSLSTKRHSIGNIERLAVAENKTRRTLHKMRFALTARHDDCGQAHGVYRMIKTCSSRSPGLASGIL